MSVLDTVGIKESIQSILESTNTVGASPVYLSNQMTRKVKSIFTINPDKIPPGLEQFPMVTIFTNSKSDIGGGIARNQLTASRNAELLFKIVGISYNENYVTEKKDPSQDDLLYLMENIEYILRGNTTLNNKVLWNMPTGINYFSVPYDEDVHMRVGEMDLTCRVLY